MFSGFQRGIVNTDVAIVFPFQNMYSARHNWPILSIPQFAYPVKWVLCRVLYDDLIFKEK